MSKFAESSMKYRSKYHTVKFAYLYVNNTVVLLEIDDEEIDENSNLYYVGNVIVRIPTWVEMHDIYRFSLIKDPNVSWKKKDKKKVDPEKYKDGKLKKLCVKFVDHEGEETYVDNEYIDNLQPRLANFILRKIDNLIDENYSSDGLTKEESKELAFECYQYYSAISKKQIAGSKSEIPTPPAAIVLKHVCEMFHCTPDTARRISKRDIDMISVANEQQSTCREPAAIGLGEKVKFKR